MYILSSDVCIVIPMPGIPYKPVAAMCTLYSGHRCPISSNTISKYIDTSQYDSQWGTASVHTRMSRHGVIAYTKHNRAP